MAKKEINVLESSEHSFLIYILNDKEMYASEIAKLVKEQQGTIQRRLMKLRSAGFIKIKEHPEKTKNIKLFYVNWNKILEEFIKLLKEQKTEFIDIHKKLKTNIKPERLELLEYLENQGFIKNLKNNKYLLYALKTYFSDISKYKKCSLSHALAYFTFFGDFEFTTLTHPSIRQVISQIELKKDLEKLEQKKDEYPSFPPKAKENTKEWYDEFKASHDKMMKDMSSRFEDEEKKIKEIKEKNLDLKVILQFNEIRKLLGMDLGLQLALNNATEQTAFYVINNIFSKQEIEKYLDDIFFKHSLRYKGVSDDVKQEVREKIENMKENDTNAPKPNEIKHKESIKK